MRHKVEKFLFASSSSVYGNTAKVPFSEEDPVAEPISPYAATKRAGELLCYTYWHLYKLPVFCLRFFTVYGPRQRPDLAIHKFTRLISRGEPDPVLRRRLDQPRLHVRRGHRRRHHAVACDHCDRYRIYNLGGSDPVTLKHARSRNSNSAIGKTAILDRRPAQLGDVERTYADLTRSEHGAGLQAESHPRRGPQALRRLVPRIRPPLHPPRRPRREGDGRVGELVLIQRG